MYRQEIVTVWEHRLNALAQRLIVRAPEEGVEPGNPIGLMLQRAELALEELQVTSISDDVHDYDHGLAGQHLAGEKYVKCL